MMKNVKKQKQELQLLTYVFREIQKIPERRIVQRRIKSELNKFKR